MASVKGRNQFAIIGMGQFGCSLAKKLSELDKEILAIDIKEEALADIKNYVTHSVVADATDENVLNALDISEFDAVIVSIGNMSASILATLLCKQLGASYVVAKAQGDKHRIVLEKIGADCVVFPEEMLGRKLATSLVNPSIGDIFELNEKFKMAEFKAPEKWAGKTLKELDIRKNFNISVLYIKSEDEDLVVSPGGDSIINLGDSIMVCGTNNDIAKFSNKLLLLKD